MYVRPQEANPIFGNDLGPCGFISQSVSPWRAMATQFRSKSQKKKNNQYVLRNVKLKLGFCSFGRYSRGGG